jgi:hypothetical protein
MTLRARGKISVVTRPRYGLTIITAILLAAWGCGTTSGDNDGETGAEVTAGDSSDETATSQDAAEETASSEAGGEETTTSEDGAGETTSSEDGSEETTTTSDGGAPATDPQGPDLQLFTLPECSVVPNGALSGADNLTLFVAVRNGGPGTIGGLVPVTVTSDTGLSSTSNNSISTGSSFNPLQVDLADTDYNRTHQFSIIVDPDNDIVERDESNNVLQVTVRLADRAASDGDVPCTSP